ncbi:hypothetical protein [Pandoraea sp.]|uniref:hypothetical protein n=1 Tax=Pandoraea sp. TaxID=1883445 RepID=UPI001214F9C4|nr:hypothetical protein [Pandoraea sp.]TAL53794.1 MAG: hypothetical protein EPN80_14095 [Pandoraea sp.]TAM17047.1 MAG: hypothetical protein EPN65_12265 [Pandoraea sp.]
MSWIEFPTSPAIFPTSRLCDPGARPVYLLSLILLKRKKNTEKKAGSRRTRTLPRVDADFPRVGGAAYFLSHESHVFPRVDSWELMGKIFNEINWIDGKRRLSINPRVALRVGGLSEAETA